MKKIFLTGSTGFLGTKFIDLYGGQYEIGGGSRSDASNSIDLLDFPAVKKAFESVQPDIVIHTAADLGRDLTKSTDIVKTNPAITKNLIDLAKVKNTPFIFTSTEAVYGGKEQGGEYKEDDPYKPRGLYGESKMLSEKLLISSGLPYLITRGFRYVGISKRFNKSKQFPDAIKALVDNQEVHLDSHRLMKACFINHISDVFHHYITSDSDKQIIINLAVNKVTTYCELVTDVAKAVGLNTDLIKPDGEETTWPQQVILSTEKMEKLGYPPLHYDEMLQVIKTDWDA